MYFPYVYGRQYELLAVSSASETYLASGRVVPIIEPVSAKSGALVRCLQVLGKAGQSAVVILNPYQGEFKDGIPKGWIDPVLECLGKYQSLLPAIVLRAGKGASSPTSAHKFINYFKGRDVAILHRKCGFTQVDVDGIAAAPNVIYHIVLDSNLPKAHEDALPKSKRVHIRDGFTKQLRNADYGVPEFFSDHHTTYKKHGIGFGDFTVIGEGFQSGGGKPGAVAFHISFVHPKNDELWVHHFLSDETDRDEGSVGGKYQEALAKLAKEYADRKIEFGANKALDAFLDDYATGDYHGLGKNKERQILHHIARVHDLLVAGN